MSPMLLPVISAAYLMSAAAAPLSLLSASFAEDTDLELSGGAYVGDELLVVSDEGSQHYLYKMSPLPGGKRFATAPALDLAKLAGWDKVKSLDLEGVASCPDGTLYLANEREREILKIDPARTTIAAVPLAYGEQASILAAGSANAGIEGVAVDCGGGRLFVGKERDPRHLFAFDLATGKLLAHGDPPPGGRTGAKIGKITINPDVADLHYTDGFLYALERNSYEIIKLDPATFADLGRVSYAAEEKDLYDTGEPYGTAELLLVTKDEILVGWDNNGAKLTKAAKKRFHEKGAHGALMRFKRPAGF